MKVFAASVLCGLAILLSSCSLFTSAEYGPQTVTGGNIDELVANGGAPDIIGGSDRTIVVGWRRTESMSILGLFQSVSEKTHVAVCDGNGNVLKLIPGKEHGKAISIFQPMPIDMPLRR